MRRYTLLSEYEKNQLIPFLYLAGLAGYKIAERLKIAPATVHRALFKNDNLKTPIEIREGTNAKYSHNKNFFKSIATPEQAYWLGFIAGDGCITKEKKCFRLQFCLHPKDKKHLQKFKRCIQYTGKVITKRNRTDLRIVSDNFYQGLIKLGITPRKSLTITDKVIPKYFQRHFIRGLWDADGWLSFYKCKHKKNYRTAEWGITGTKKLLLGIQRILIDNLGVSKAKIKNDIRKNKNIGEFLYGGNQQVLKICGWLYQEPCTYYLDRKYERYLEIRRKLSNNG